MKHAFGKQEMLRRLEQLNDDVLSLYPDRGPFDLIIVGGSAIVLRDLAPNKTQTIDIDALQTAAELEELMARYDINSNADTFRYQFPSGFTNRLVVVPFDGTMLRLFTLSNEDLAITKLLAWREQDQDDFQGMLSAGNINLEALRHIVDNIEELRINLEQPDWDVFCSRLAKLESWAV